jgi:hypothetical protein
LDRYKYNMKEVILKIINEKPKHFSKIIKNNDQLNQWVINNTLVTSTNYSEMIYSAKIIINGYLKIFLMDTQDVVEPMFVHVLEFKFQNQ